MTTRGASFRDAVLALVVLAGCGARAQLYLNQCGDPGGVCVDVAPTASKVVYRCNAHVHLYFIDESHQGEIPVCLPPALNRWTGTPAQVAALDAMTQHDYDVAVTKYGQGVLLPQIAALKAVDATGSNCFVWQAGLGDPESACNVVESTRDPFCESAPNCAPTVCVPDDCHDPLLPDGTINPHACTCNTTVSGPDDCEIPGATVCIAPD